MDILKNLFGSIGLNLYDFLIVAGVLLAGTVVFGFLGRFVFGKRSVLNCSISSAMAIVFIYALTVVLKSSGLQFDQLIAPLPLVSISNGSMTLFSFAGAHYTTICSELLSMVILAFLVNLADGWMPKGKNLISWTIFRFLTVVIAFILHCVVVWLFKAFLPEGLVIYAPTVLLGLLVIMLLTGALKILVGAVLTTVNPIIGGLYTFFFATVIGKQVSKAMLTTLILTGAVMLLRYLGIVAISIAMTALYAYIPFLLVLLLIWYLVSQLL